MNAYLQSRTPRERAALGLAVFLLAIAAVYVLFTEPGAVRLQRSRAQIESASAAHAHVVGIARHVSESGQATGMTKRPLPPDQTLMSVIDATAVEAGITGAVKRLVPTSERDVSVVLEAVPFDQLMIWLSVLHADYGLEIDQFTANPGASHGHTNVSLVVSL